MGVPVKDNTGLRIGDCLVIGRDDSGAYPDGYWIVRCGCGNTFTRLGNTLRRAAKAGRRVSCGCAVAEISRAARALKRVPCPVGLVVNRLKVAGEDSDCATSGSVRRWLCDCLCGGSISYPATSIRAGSARSCGCVAIEHATRKALSALETAITNGTYHQLVDLITAEEEWSFAPEPEIVTIPAMPNAEARPWPTLPIEQRRAA